MQRIPDNWYRRADDYKLAKVHFDTVQVLLEAPPTMKLGGNTGQVNFAGVDISNITGGVYNTKNLLQGNILACFAYQAFQMDFSRTLSGLFTNLQPALNILSTYIAPQFANLGCPELTQYDGSVFGTYPGTSDTSH
ncbi:hypothetical protein FRC08_004447 [Ceratobasidium sp. 394]|nr:hypothetical protein FRC08_004447 [Ceratobasidium sp. 394]